MSDVLATNHDDAHAIMARVLLAGDLSKLSDKDKVLYYNEVCKSVGLNPLTRPFEYITLQGKHVLYAKRDATEQLRMLHGVSIIELTKEWPGEGMYIVTAKAMNKDGRTDIGTGAVHVGELKGDMRANAIMKCETKAKRRVTLSICGLGFLDETELDTIPGVKKGYGPTPEKRAESAKQAPYAQREGIDITTGTIVGDTIQDATGKVIGQAIVLLDEESDAQLRTAVDTPFEGEVEDTARYHQRDLAQKRIERALFKKSPGLGTIAKLQSLHLDGLPWRTSSLTAEQLKPFEDAVKALPEMDPRVNEKTPEEEMLQTVRRLATEKSLSTAVRLELWKLHTGNVNPNDASLDQLIALRDAIEAL